MNVCVVGPVVLLLVLGGCGDDSTSSPTGSIPAPTMRAEACPVVEEGVYSVRGTIGDNTCNAPVGLSTTTYTTIMAGAGDPTCTELYRRENTENCTTELDIDCADIRLTGKSTTYTTRYFKFVGTLRLKVDACSMNVTYEYRKD